MDGSQGSTVEAGAAVAPFFPTLVPVKEPVLAVDGLVQVRLDDHETLLITKTKAGFDEATVEALRQVVRDAAAGRLGALKFLAFEFAHDGDVEGPRADGLPALVNDVANLILRAPVVSVACARASIAGADLEFALACSMLIGEDGATFSFAGDPATSLSVYGFLAQKLGFVRAERLMENGEILDAQQMHGLLLLKDVAPKGAGRPAIETFLRKTGRRHNSCYGIYRAQRIASPAHDGGRGARA